MRSRIWAHASIALVEFSNFPASISFVYCLLLFLSLLLVFCAFTQINQKLCSILSELRSNDCQNVYRKTDSILLSFFFSFLLSLSHPIMLQCEYVTIFFSEYFGVLSHHIVQVENQNRLIFWKFDRLQFLRY